MKANQSTLIITQFLYKTPNPRSELFITSHLSLDRTFSSVSSIIILSQELLSIVYLPNAIIYPHRITLDMWLDWFTNHLFRDPQGKYRRWWTRELSKFPFSIFPSSLPFVCAKTAAFWRGRRTISLIFKFMIRSQIVGNIVCWIVGVGHSTHRKKKSC